MANFDIETYYNKQKEELINPAKIEAYYKTREENKNSSLIIENKNSSFVIDSNNKKYTFDKSLSREYKEKEIREKENRLFIEIQENHEQYLKLYPKLKHRNKIKDFDFFKTDFDFQKDIKNIAFDYINNIANSSWFFIYGQNGSGKTCICEVIINELLNKYNFSVCYIEFSIHFKELKALSNNIQQLTLLEKYRKTDLLFIDDLFKRDPTSSDLILLFDIIDYRYNLNKITLFNSQKLFTDIAFFDQALFSRIYEKANNYLIQIPYNTKFNYRLLK